ncbi:MAG: DNA primase [Fimbriimonas sp.]
MADERDDIRARIDIVDLVGREIQLKKTGRTYKGLCPFHQDRNPSFTVSSETGRYKCWSCGEAGDIFTWEMKRRNVDFIEALQTLAKEAGVALKTRKDALPPSVRLQQEAAMIEALSFFREQLAKNSSASEYCERRGLDQPVVDYWEMGYAPDVGGALAVRLKKQGFSLAECKSLFLVDEDASGGYYDKFRGRLMFPIRDEKGQLVAFGGRVLGDAHPKYINSSDTPLYRKSRVLYGMNKAKDSISKLRQAVLVEGYTDVIACHRGSITNALASLGTALAEDHAKLLKRWCDEVVILYDSDDAGRKAAERGIEILRVEGLKVRVALMAQGEDPDTLLKNGGPAALQEAVDGALSPIDYKLKALAQRHDVRDNDYWIGAIKIIAESESRPEVDRHLNEIAHKYPWERNATKALAQLAREVNAVRSRLRRGLQQERPTILPEHHSVKGALSSAEIVMLQGCLTEDLRDITWRFACTSDLYETTTGERIGEALRNAFPDAPPKGRSSDWLHHLEPEELRQTLSDLTMDFRSENLTQERLIDAIQKLKNARDQRETEALRRSGASAQELFERLRQRKTQADGT